VLGVSRDLCASHRRLEGRKLLQRTPNIGVRVALSLKDLHEILQVREALKAWLCSRCANYDRWEIAGRGR